MVILLLPHSLYAALSDQLSLKLKAKVSKVMLMHFSLVIG